MDLNVEQVSVAELTPYVANARFHSEAQIAEIASSIAEFGFSNPILIRKNGTVIAGHGRLLAARHLGMHTVPVIRLNHLTDTQARLLTLADNKIAEKSSWDADMLKAELDNLNDTENWSEIVKTGFSETELENLLDEAIDIEEDHSDTNNSPDVVRFRNYNIEISPREADALIEALELYAEEKGSFFGFFNYILKGLK
ncbi:MAG: ParB N-terminal domain-containing protein [Myxococcales bacterium]|nr:ParB N-terminal domain-containing protein [Myxococcales bacterium]